MNNLKTFLQTYTNILNEQKQTSDKMSGPYNPGMAPDTPEAKARKETEKFLDDPFGLKKSPLHNGMNQLKEQIKKAAAQAQKKQQEDIKPKPADGTSQTPAAPRESAKQSEANPVAKADTKKQDEEKPVIKPSYDSTKLQSGKLSDHIYNDLEPLVNGPIVDSYKNINKNQVSQLINTILSKRNLETINNFDGIVVSAKLKTTKKPDKMVYESEFLTIYSKIIAEAEQKSAIPNVTDQKSSIPATSSANTVVDTGDTVLADNSSTGDILLVVDGPNDFKFIDVNTNEQITSKESLHKLDNFLQRNKHILRDAIKTTNDKANGINKVALHTGVDAAYTAIKQNILNIDADINTIEAKVNKFTADYKTQLYDKIYDKDNADLYDQDKFLTAYYAICAFVMLWCNLLHTKFTKPETNDSSSPASNNQNTTQTPSVTATSDTPGTPSSAVSKSGEATEPPKSANKNQPTQTETQSFSIPEVKAADTGSPIELSQTEKQVLNKAISDIKSSPDKSIRSIIYQICQYKLTDNTSVGKLTKAQKCKSAIKICKQKIKQNIKKSPKVLLYLNNISDNDFKTLITNN